MRMLSEMALPQGVDLHVTPGRALLRIPAALALYDEALLPLLIDELLAQPELWILDVQVYEPSPNTPLSPADSLSGQPVVHAIVPAHPAILWVRNDFVPLMFASLRAAQLTPDTVKENGHAPFYEQPEVVSAAIARFVAGVLAILMVIRLALARRDATRYAPERREQLVAGGQGVGVGKLGANGLAVTVAELLPRGMEAAHIHTLLVRHLYAHAAARQPHGTVMAGRSAELPFLLTQLSVHPCELGKIVEYSRQLLDHTVPCYSHRGEVGSTPYYWSLH